MTDTFARLTSSEPTGRRAIRVSHEDAILAAAEIMFAERGFNGTTMASIATAAGLPKSNVHYYFSTKEQLYRQVVGRILDAWLDAAGAFDEREEATDALSRYIAAKMDLARERPHGSRVFATEIMRGAPVVQDYLETTLRDWIERRSQVIDHWVASGQLRPVDPRALLFMIWATTQHYADFAHQIATLNNGRPLSDTEFEIAKAQVIGIILIGVEMR